MTISSLRPLALAPLVLIALLLGPPPQAAPTAQTAQRMQRVGQLGGLVTAVTTDGVTALVAEGESLLRLDVSSAGTPSVIASLNLERGVIQDVVEAFPLTYALTEEGLVVVQGVHDAPLPQPIAFVPGGGQRMALGSGAIFVAARSAGLRVIDVSVPQQAHALAELSLPGQAVDIALSPNGDLAFVAAGESGVHIVDVGNPAQPALLGTLDRVVVPPSDAVAVANSSAGPLLYVGAGDRVMAFELPTLDRPIVAESVGQYAPLAAGRRVAVSPNGDFAFVADSTRGLYAFDLSVASQPLQIYADPAPAEALDVALSSEGDLALVTAGKRGLRIIDVANSFSPVDRFVVPLTGTAEGVAFSSDQRRAFVALGGGGLGVVDVSVGAVTGVLSIGGTTHDVVSDGRWIYAALGESGLAVLRTDQGGGLSQIAGLDLPGDAHTLWKLGDTLYIAAGEAGLLAVDVLRPAEPTLVGQLVPDVDGARYVDLAVSGKRGFVADGLGVAVVDIADPTRMVHLTRLDAGPAESVALFEEGIDRFLYVLSDKQLGAYEVSISTNPVLLGTYRPIQDVSRIVPHADRLLLANAGDGPAIVVLNTSNPRLPREEGWYGQAGHSFGAAAHGDSVLVAGGLGGLADLSFDDQSNLRLQGVYKPLPDLARVIATDDWLLAGGGGGWSLVDASDSVSLRPIGRAGESLRVRDFDRDGDFVVVVAGGELASFDMSDPNAPTLVQRREITGLGVGVALDERYVYVADGSGGLEVFAREDLRSVMRVPLPAGANALALHTVSRLAYLPLEDGSLAVVDVAEPTGGLRSLGRLDLGSPAALVRAPGGTNNRALALAGRELSLVDLDNSLARLDTTLLPKVGDDLMLNDEGLFVGTSDGELDIYAVPGVSNLAYLDSLPVAARDMVSYGGVLYLALGEAGLGALPPDSDTVINADSSSRVEALLLDGNSLYSGGTHFKRYDLVDPSAPREAISLPLEAPAQHIALVSVGGDETRTFYVSTVNGIDVVRESAGGEIALAARIPVPSGVRQIVVAGNRAYANSASGGLLVLSTADIDQPVTLFTYRSAMGTHVRDLLLVGDELLVSWDGGLELLEIGASSALPALLTTIPTGGVRALDVALADNRAYVSLGPDGVAILDVSVPADPSTIGAFDTPGISTHVAGYGDLLFVADGTCGLRVMDVGDPRSPREVGFWASGFTNDVAVSPSGDVIYAANGDALIALRFQTDGPPVAPPTPRDPTPADGGESVRRPTRLAWSPPSDPCNPLRYEVSLGISVPPPVLGRVAGEPILDAGDLRGLTTYHWQVRAIDLQGDVSESPVWTFTTSRGGQGGFVSPDEPPIFLAWLRAIGWIPLVVGSLGMLGLIARLRRRTNRKQSEPD